MQAPSEYQAMLLRGEALSFLGASRKLSVEAWSSPKYYLQIHAIELAGKSYLLAKGEDIGKVTKIRHDLLKIFDECRSHGLTLAHPRADWIIGLIAPVHKDHRLRYITGGETELPNFAELDGFCEELIRHVGRLLHEIEKRCRAEEDAGGD
jgi:hypothetical protein